MITVFLITAILLLVYILFSRYVLHQSREIKKLDERIHQAMINREIQAYRYAILMYAKKNELYIDLEEIQSIKDKMTAELETDFLIKMSLTK